jgi:hypothetical protein
MSCPLLLNSRNPSSSTLVVHKIPECEDPIFQSQNILRSPYTTVVVLLVSADWGNTQDKGKKRQYEFYRGADKSLVRSTSRYSLFDGENISFDVSLVIYIYIYIYIYSTVWTLESRTQSVPSGPTYVLVPHVACCRHALGLPESLQYLCGFQVSAGHSLEGTRLYAPRYTSTWWERVPFNSKTLSVANTA